MPDTVLAPLTLGTAGHIDHGKTALIRALTGVDTDRLPEERERGISIELGYAPLTLPGGRRLSVVDVPGHERFVRTMVAGATGIDLYLMTVAADDGVMPQTREHAAVLAALGVRAGVVAVTKADVADPGPALEQAAELLPGAEAVAVSARTGEGLDALAAALDRAAAGLPGRAGAGGGLVLHVDRAFTIRGAGTVVTGTLWSGSAGRGDHVELLPSGERARVRGVQVHDAVVDRAQAGQRVALNLAGVPIDRVARGDVVVGDARNVPGTVLARPEVTYRVDAALDWISPELRPAGGARVAVHHGTREIGGADRRARRPLRAAAARAAARPARGRPARDPLAGAARHARRRRRARPRPAPPRAVAATCWPASRGSSAASRSPSRRRRPHRARAAPGRRRPRPPR